MCKCCNLSSGEFCFLNEQETIWIKRYLDDYSIETEEGSTNINYCPVCGKMLKKDVMDLKPSLNNAGAMAIPLITPDIPQIDIQKEIQKQIEKSLLDVSNLGNNLMQGGM